jgi:hypothetical protein
MKSQKGATRKIRADWRLALAEGRVVHYPDMMRSTAFPTVERAEAALLEAQAAGIRALLREKTL